MTAHSRDHRNWKKGYNEALHDIAIKLVEAGPEAAAQWINDNATEATLKTIREQVHFQSPFDYL